MTQPDLFTTPKTYSNGRSAISRSCSQAGAIQAQPKAESQCDRILASLRAATAIGNGLTLHELAAGVHLPLATVCARIGFLKQQGLVTESGTTRPGPTGVANHVIIAAKRTAE